MQDVAAAKPAVVYVVVETATGAKSGTGFAVRSDATTTTIVTANHVIEGGTGVDVIFDGDEHERYTAEVLAHDHAKDVAILRVPVGSRATLDLEDAKDIQEGASIVLIGYPLATLEFHRLEGDSLRPTVHQGIVSAIRFNGEIIQFDASSYHGDSGGPIIDVATGRVIAIVFGILKDSQYAAVGLEQTLPGASYGPSSTRIASVLNGTAPAAGPAVGANEVSKDAGDKSGSAPSVSTHVGVLATSASYRVGYGVPHEGPGFGSPELVRMVDDAVQSSVLDRLTAFLKSDNSLYLVPVNLNPSAVQDSASLAGYCDDQRLNALVFPSYGWNLSGGPSYNVYGRQVGYNGQASVSMSFYVVDCYGSSFFFEKNEKSEGRRFARRGPDREVVDMANDLLDHLMADFASARTAHQAAWQSLLKTGLPFDPNDGIRHALLRWVKKPEGFQVTVVVPGGPADKAGVKVQDIITKVNDVDVTSMSQDDFVKQLGTAESCTLLVERPGGLVSLTVHPETYADLVKSLQH